MWTKNANCRWRWKSQCCWSMQCDVEEDDDEGKEKDVQRRCCCCCCCSVLHTHTTQMRHCQDRSHASCELYLAVHTCVWSPYTYVHVHMCSCRHTTSSVSGAYAKTLGWTTVLLFVPSGRKDVKKTFWISSAHLPLFNCSPTAVIMSACTDICTCYTCSALWSKSGITIRMSWCIHHLTRDQLYQHKLEYAKHYSWSLLPFFMYYARCTYILCI